MGNELAEFEVKVLQVSYCDETKDVIVCNSGANGEGGGSFKVPRHSCKTGDTLTLTIRPQSPIVRPLSKPS
jgi:hypothetical protein